MCYPHMDLTSPDMCKRMCYLKFNFFYITSFYVFVIVINLILFVSFFFACRIVCSLPPSITGKVEVVQPKALEPSLVC
jgi:hypothetical protein